MMMTFARGALKPSSNIEVVTRHLIPPDFETFDGLPPNLEPLWNRIVSGACDAVSQLFSVVNFVHQHEHMIVLVLAGQIEHGTVPISRRDSPLDARLPGDDGQ